MTKLKLYTDGGARGNPGPAAYGYVVYSDAAIILEKCGNYLGITTNNQAEYAGLIAGLQWILAHYPAAQVEIFLDSLLVINQVKGLYRVKHPELLPKHQEVRRLLARLPGFTVAYIPRAQNSLADSLVNSALDEQLS